jgi:hypothetical protein
MPGYNRRRFQSVDFIKRGNPFQPGLPVRFAEKWVNAVIDNVASDYQSDGRDVKTRRIVIVVDDHYNDGRYTQVLEQAVTSLLPG